MIGAAGRTMRGNKRLAVYDGYNRADSGTLGTSPSGHTWTAVGGTYSIGSNTLRENGGNGATATVPFTNPDQLVIATIVDNLKTGCGFTARVSAAGLYLAQSDANGAYRLFKFIAPSTFTVLFNGNGLASGDRLGIYCKGSNISLLRNGVVVFSIAADPLLLTSTSVGYRSGTTSSPKIFDDFKVYAI